MAARHLILRGSRFPLNNGMKLATEYLADAAKFERLARAERENLKAQLEKQALAYRKLAKERAEKLGCRSLPIRPRLLRRPLLCTFPK